MVVTDENRYKSFIRTNLRKCLPKPTTTLWPSRYIEGALEERVDGPGTFSRAMILVDMALTREEFFTLWDPFYACILWDHNYTHTKFELKYWNGTATERFPSLYKKRLGPYIQEHIQFNNDQSGTPEDLEKLLRHNLSQGEFAFIFFAPQTVSQLDHIHQRLANTCTIYTIGNCTSTNRYLHLCSYDVQNGGEIGNESNNESSGENSSESE